MSQRDPVVSNCCTVSGILFSSDFYSKSTKSFHTTYLFIRYNMNLLLLDWKDWNTLFWSKAVYVFNPNLALFFKIQKDKDAMLHDRQFSLSNRYFILCLSMPYLSTRGIISFVWYRGEVKETNEQIFWYKLNLHSVENGKVRYRSSFVVSQSIAL